MNKLIILVGISGAGKSTWAAKKVKEDPNKYVRVNRDKLREMLYGYTENNVNYYYERPDLYKLENQVTAVENNLIKELLKTKSVIVDATHLKVKYLNRFSIFSKYPIEIKLIESNTETAIKRVSKRTRWVDNKIIYKQYVDYLRLKQFLSEGDLKFSYICNTYEG